MNQILQNPNQTPQPLQPQYIQSSPSQEPAKKHFKVIFIISIITILVITSFYMYNTYKLRKNEKISNRLSYNYHTLKLYNGNNSNTYINLPNTVSYTENAIIGEIKIPSIEISYPIFSMLDDDTLKVSPCIFYGKLPPDTGNLCIAGHNYNNNQFFSLIYKLKKEDKIYIYDLNNHEYVYSVFANYEVKTDDLSPIYLYNKNQCELTLVTCNNLNNNRIIIKAKLD